MNADVLRAAYGAFANVVRPLGDEESWRPTGCAGWAVRDLVFHCAGDAQRALVALHTPAAGPPDRDAVTYWRDWAPDPVGAAQGRRWNRVSASMFLDFHQLRDLYLETTAATVNAAADAPPDLRVRTQGHVLTAEDLVLTLAVEATVHHLDLVTDLPDAPGPSPAGLAAVRATLDGLLGWPVPIEWSDEHYARAATGRTPLTDAERLALGADADRFPLFS
ncbi:maleylpyruvate isomerase N-terminal domain-containing protein [Streptomyces sp. A2-16]|uniref:maleylpyruvate isomerase N-terminal domain-containing protein n=1 Tax=Streptomyces sp. A2-16 TaxID=2781734 RepID=UPI001BAEC84C|nr:maleylpyruvate isomerase N-terminal domain-containing protein [Streptomyces sp. A2-16]QUC58542.1 maleylpyruvate isomerase N-terminal domain-containing protein [Streptomyces sp. A2-16]